MFSSLEPSSNSPGLEHSILCQKLEKEVDAVLASKRVDRLVMQRVDILVSDVLRLLHQQVLEEISLSILSYNIDTSGFGKIYECTTTQIYTQPDILLLPCCRNACENIGARALKYLNDICRVLNHLKIHVKYGDLFSGKRRLCLPMTQLESLSLTVIGASGNIWCALCNQGGCFCPVIPGLVITHSTVGTPEDVSVIFCTTLGHRSAHCTYGIDRFSVHGGKSYRQLIDRFILYWTNAIGTSTSGPYSLLHQSKHQSATTTFYQFYAWRKVVLDSKSAVLPSYLHDLADQSSEESDVNPSIFMCSEWDVIDETLALLSPLNGMGEHERHPYGWFLDIQNPKTWKGILSSNYVELFLDESGGAEHWFLQELEPLHIMCDVYRVEKLRNTLSCLEPPLRVWADVVIRVGLAAEAYKMSEAGCAKSSLRTDWLKNAFALLWQAAAISVRKSQHNPNSWKKVLACLLCRAFIDLRCSTKPLRSRSADSLLSYHCWSLR
jgi:hypothetical protein